MAKATINLRVSPERLAEIDRRARAAQLTRTEYMLRCAIGEGPVDADIDHTLDNHEERIARLERAAFGD